MSVSRDQEGEGTAEVQATFAATLVDEWIRGGVSDVVICPGSRSTPMALALADRASTISIHVRLDERGAGFFALGLSMANPKGAPAAILVTSGTAAGELHPCVIEAHHARVPLIVVTADRPPELHDVGANQTIDQKTLFGSALRWNTDPGPARKDDKGTWRALGARIVIEATSNPKGPGPVHCNLAFREPLVGLPGPLPLGRQESRPWVRVNPGTKSKQGTMPLRISDQQIEAWSKEKGLIVVGSRCGTPKDVISLSRRLTWPLLADPRSMCRWIDPWVIASAEAIVATVGKEDILIPDVVLQIGAPWVSPVVRDFVAKVPRVIAVDPWWSWRDEKRVVSEILTVDPALWLTGLHRGDLAQKDLSAWSKAWRMRDDAVQASMSIGLEIPIDNEAPKDAALTEPLIAREIMKVVPPDTAFVVSSSMPVRDLEEFVPALKDPPLVVSNRGASGIDGVASTAQGFSAGSERHVVCILGDLAFFHDVSSLLLTKGQAQQSSCTLLVIDNGGGGIFSFLPQSSGVDKARFEHLFSTPMTQDVISVAEGFGLPVADVSTWGECVAALEKFVGHVPLSVICARVPNRRENVAIHQKLREGAAQAIGLCERGTMQS